jgi:hypothetical protein
MAKGQKRSSREARKPKAQKPPKVNAAHPSNKLPVVGLVTIKN